MFATGQGVPQDDVEAMRWYRLAGEQGFSWAQSKLGEMYFKGQGVPEDYIQAHMWASLAAAKDRKGAAELRDIVANKMTLEQYVESRRLTREWLAQGQQ
ncbi:MAG: sel1 repeat family protein [Nitrospirales bacterium]|nr:sel1 repeat family protein [Nitrospirales bacterium]